MNAATEFSALTAADLCCFSVEAADATIAHVPNKAVIILDGRHVTIVDASFMGNEYGSSYASPSDAEQAANACLAALSKEWNTVEDVVEDGNFEML